jgi:tRNA A-37 threonylcarbamoyl transferase component Bud32
MSWPTPQDYNEAIQNPVVCFQDVELKRCTPDANVLGLPRPITGAFASVYRLSSPEKHWAVRCFLQDTPALHHRYAEISRFVLSDTLPYTVDVDYQDTGIKVKGEWHPMVKMEWVNGVTLDQYLFENLENKEKLTALRDSFKKMVGDLREAGIAHGDLQHSNIIVADEKIYLVDYDGMFVPALSGMQSNELGHINYQSPHRSSRHFAAYLDNFSAWSILTSIECLIQDSTLWEWLGAGDECLLFRKVDYVNPIVSRSFATLEGHLNENIRKATKLFRAILEYPVEQVPACDEVIREAHDLPAIEQAPFASPIARRENSLPIWMVEGPSFVPDTEKLVPRGAWPRYEHYLKSLESPLANFDDFELQAGKLDLEQTRCGRNGVVFKLNCFKRQVAVKVFFNDVPDRQKRFELIARAISVYGLEQYFVDFEYLPAALKVGNYWYPALKMDWCYNLTLEQFLKIDLGNRNLDRLRNSLSCLVTRLNEAGIAHGDLEPANILVQQINPKVSDFNQQYLPDLKLIDYDAMFVPEMTGMFSPELGNPKFQHPSRTRRHFGTYLDNYAGWILDTYIYIASVNPDLWGLLNARMRNDPTGDPDEDWTFRYIAMNPNPFIRKRVLFLRKLLDLSIENIPLLKQEVYDYSIRKEFLKFWNFMFSPLQASAAPRNEESGTEARDLSR